jgi:hypothetical protein
MAADLDHCLGAHIGLYLLPVPVVELQGLDEALVLIIAPTLTLFRQRVGLPALLAAGGGVLHDVQDHGLPARRKRRVCIDLNALISAHEPMLVNMD